MVIRKYEEEELDDIIELWYKVSIKAHDFISYDYWESGKSEMKEKYIPMSETYVIEEDKKIIGFISMVQDYLAAIFIDIEYQNKGYGKTLLDYIKTQKNHIELKAYKKNSKTINFYLKNGFKVKEESVDEETGELEYLMEWIK